jgi:succinyl-CoA synthetase alpha subunit
MSIFLNENSKVIVQGMTGSEGRKHTQRMLASGHAIVGGVNPRRPARASTSTAPASRCSARRRGDEGDRRRRQRHLRAAGRREDAVIEAVDAQIGLAVVITEGIPVHDSTYVWAHAQGGSTRIIGPNCPGLISPGRSNAGIIPANITKAGHDRAWSASPAR